MTRPLGSEATATAGATASAGMPARTQRASAMASARSPSLLFLTHSAGRNGASLLLLHLLQWLRANTSYRLSVLSSGDGPLIADYRAVAQTHVWRNPFDKLRIGRHGGAATLAARAEALMLRGLLGRRRHDLIYANTAASWRALTALRRIDSPVLWHIHELPYALSLTLDHGAGRALLPGAARVVAASEAVARTLIYDFAVAPDRVDSIYGFVPPLELSPAERQARRARVRAALGWPQDAFVVGACGTLGWRKGADLFLQIARQCSRRATGADLRFLWVGGGAPIETAAIQFEYDRAKLGLNAVCSCVPTTADVHDYYSAMDAFVLTSREEPFGLVLLEAALHELPIVCFDSAGGAPEFVSKGAGLVVPYLELGAFCNAIDTLCGSAELRARLGAAGRRMVLDEHSAESQGPKLLRSIERCLAAA